MWGRAGVYRPTKNRKVFLYYTKKVNGDGHFDCITSIKGMLCASYFCFKCLKGFNDTSNHKCETTCDICRSTSCIPTKPQTCTTCNAECRSAACYEKHKVSNSIAGKTHPSRCEKYWTCPSCKTVLDTTQRDKDLHICGEWTCKTCKETFTGEHFCHMRALTPKPTKPHFVFFDFECHQQTGTHVPNFAVAQTVCADCEHENVTDESCCATCGDRCAKCSKWDPKLKAFAQKPCDGCGKRQVIFEGENTKQLFGAWLFNPLRKNTTVLAHNARGYDSYFLLSYLLENSIVPKLIFSGTKVMYMHVERGLDIRVLDSLNFLPMRLAALPKAFDLSEIKKGWFPHYFNTPENANYVGAYPPQEMYGVNSMSTGDRDAFLEWYSGVEGEFNLRR